MLWNCAQTLLVHTQIVSMMIRSRFIRCYCFVYNNTDMSASLFCKPQRFYSVRCHIYRVMSTVYEPQLFIAASIFDWCPRFCMYQRFYSVRCHIYQVVSTVYEPQRFISVYCQFVFLSGACATTDVGAYFPSRVHSRKGNTKHSSKPKAQKNRLVFLLRFCPSPLQIF